MNQARSLWAGIARRAQSAWALFLATEALSALAYEMEAYEHYRRIERAMFTQEQEEEEEEEASKTLRDYGSVLTLLSLASEGWWKTVGLLQSCAEQSLPALTSKEALLTGCLAQRLRVMEVSTHIMKLHLAAQESREVAQTHGGEKGARWHG